MDAVSAYTYDGEGQRVRKLVNENLRFIYDMGGKVIAEFNGTTGTLTKKYIYGASGLVATIEPTAINANGTRYTTSDSLGSPRVVTNSSVGVVSRHDYMPFGEELFNGGRTTAMGYGVADGVRQKFTSKERDNETGLDYFVARYYSSAQGRFTTSDPVLLMPDRLYDPQRINLYAYCRNNPLAFLDPTGETISYKDKDSEKAYKDYVAYLEKCGKKCEQELATVIQLKDSDVNYIIQVGGKQESETAEGNTTPDEKGENIMVRIRNVGGPQGEKFDMNGRFAHELEHGRLRRTGFRKDARW